MTICKARLCSSTCFVRVVFGWHWETLFSCRWLLYYIVRWWHLAVISVRYAPWTLAASLWRRTHMV